MGKDFLRVHGISIHWQYMYCKDRLNIYEIIFKNNYLEYLIIFLKDSFNNSKNIKKGISVYDCLTLLVNENPGSYEDFIRNYPEAEHLYEGVIRQWKAVRKFFTRNQLHQLKYL